MSGDAREVERCSASPLSPDTRRALRLAGLRLAQARQDYHDAIVAAHASGADIGQLGRELRMDLFDVRDVLATAGVLAELAPKETRARSGTPGSGRPAPTAPARSGG